MPRRDVRLAHGLMVRDLSSLGTFNSKVGCQVRLCQNRSTDARFDGADARNPNGATHSRLLSVDDETI